MIPVTFPAEVNMVSFPVPIGNDTRFESGQYFILELEIPPEAEAMDVIMGSPNTATVHIVDEGECCFNVLVAPLKRTRTILVLPVHVYIYNIVQLSECTNTILLVSLLSNLIDSCAPASAVRILLNAHIGGGVLQSAVTEWNYISDTSSKIH